MSNITLGWRCVRRPNPARRQDEQARRPKADQRLSCVVCAPPAACAQVAAADKTSNNQHEKPAVQAKVTLQQQPPDGPLSLGAALSKPSAHNIIGCNWGL
jgi:hypothetical protein